MSPRRSRGASHRETKASKQSVSTAPRERQRRDHPAQPQAPGQRDVCASLARHALDDARPAWRTSVGPRHGQVKAGLVGKNKPPALQRCHPLAEGLTVGLHLLGRRQTFFYGAAPAAATPGRRSPGGLRLWLYASGSSPTPRGWRPGLGAPARATARAACRATRRDSRRRVTVARGSPRRDTFGAGGSPSDVRLRRCLPLHRVCLRRPRRRELFSRGGQLSKPSWPMSVATHSANASANRNREEITRRGVDPRLAHFVVDQGRTATEQHERPLARGARRVLRALAIGLLGDEEHHGIRGPTSRGLRGHQVFAEFAYTARNTRREPVFRTPEQAPHRDCRSVIVLETASRHPQAKSIARRVNA